jgi:hypothetical protein
MDAELEFYARNFLHEATGSKLGIGLINLAAKFELYEENSSLKTPVWLSWLRFIGIIIRKIMK